MDMEIDTDMDLDMDMDTDMDTDTHTWARTISMERTWTRMSPMDRDLRIVLEFLST